MVEVSLNVDTESNVSLLSFPQGIPSESLAKVSIGEKGVGSKRKRMIVTDFNGTIFEGKDYADHSWRKNSTQFAVGLLDEKSGEMRVIPVDHAFVMRIVSEDDSAGQITEMGLAERRQSLTDAFGSRKKKRALKAAQSNIISTENIAGAEAICKAISAPNEDVDPEEPVMFADAAKDAMEKQRQSLLPKYNSEASKLEEIYIIENIIPNNIIECLLSEYDTLRPDDFDEEIDELPSSSDISISTCQQKLQYIHAPMIIKYILSNIILSSNNNTNKKTFGYLIYLTYLIQYCNFLFSTHKNKVTEESLLEQKWHPNIHIRRYIIQTYTARRKFNDVTFFQASKIQLDKLVLVIIVICLVLGNYRVHLETLAKELGISINRIMTLAKETGCKVEKRNNQTGAEEEMEELQTGGGSGWIAKLVYPIKFPSHIRGRTNSRK